MAAPVPQVPLLDNNAQLSHEWRKWLNDLAENSGGGGATSGTVQVGTVGELLECPTDTVPDDYLECDGSSVTTAAYPDLFAAIGYEYGGSGANFNSPR